MDRNFAGSFRRLATTAMAAVFGFTAVAAAHVPIPIANAGFEADPVSPGCFQVLDVADWDVFDPNGIVNPGGNVVGGLNLPPGSAWFPTGAPEGDHGSAAAGAAEDNVESIRALKSRTSPFGDRKPQGIRSP